MKKILLFVFAAIPLIGNCQQWAMDEAAEEAESIGSISSSSILLFSFILILCYFCMKISRSFKSMPYSRYVKLRKKTVTWLLILSLFVFANAVGTFYAYRAIIKSDAEKEFLKICNNYDAYVEETYLDGRIEVVEISCADFKRPTEPTIDDWLFSTFTNLQRKTDGFNHDGKDGAYYCYYILRAPKISLAWAKCINEEFSSGEGPYLYRCYYQPERIRYFNKFPNPNVDIRNSFVDFSNKLLGSYSVKVITDWDPRWMNKLLRNKYFELNPVEDDIRPKLCDDKTEMKLGSDIYEYVTINYGNFEILYSVWYVSKWGIGDRYEMTEENNPMSSEKVYQTDLKNLVLRIGLLFGLIWIAVIVTLFANKPNKD